MDFRRGTDKEGADGISDARGALLEESLSLPKAQVGEAPPSVRRRVRGRLVSAAPIFAALVALSAAAHAQEQQEPDGNDSTLWASGDDPQSDAPAPPPENVVPNAVRFIYIVPPPPNPLGPGMPADPDADVIVFDEKDGLGRALAGYQLPAGHTNNEIEFCIAFDAQAFPNVTAEYVATVNGAAVTPKVRHKRNNHAQRDETLFCFSLLGVHGKTIEFGMSGGDRHTVIVPDFIPPDPERAFPLPPRVKPSEFEHSQPWTIAGIPLQARVAARLLMSFPQRKALGGYTDLALGAGGSLVTPVQLPWLGETGIGLAAHADYAERQLQFGGAPGIDSTYAEGLIFRRDVMLALGVTADQVLLPSERSAHGLRWYASFGYQHLLGKTRPGRHYGVESGVPRSMNPALFDADPGTASLPMLVGEAGVCGELFEQGDGMFGICLGIAYQRALQQTRLVEGAARFREQMLGVILSPEWRSPR